MLISTNSGIHSAKPEGFRVPMFEAIEVLAKAGFEAIDVNFAATIYPQPEKHEDILDGDDWRDTVRALKAHIEKCGLVISHTHLPFYNYSDKENKNNALREMMMDRAIEASVLLGAPWAVLHPSKSEDPDECYEKTLVECDAWIKKATELDLGIAVENMSATPYETIIRIIDALRDKGYKVGNCWDCGHANRRGINQYEALTALGERVKVLHIHDNFGAGDDHLPPPFGRIVWEDFCRGLHDISYGGTFNYEVNLTRLDLEYREDNLRHLIKFAKNAIAKIGL